MTSYLLGRLTSRIVDRRYSYLRNSRKAKKLYQSGGLLRRDDVSLIKLFDRHVNEVSIFRFVAAKPQISLGLVFGMVGAPGVWFSMREVLNENLGYRSRNYHCFPGHLLGYNDAEHLVNQWGTDAPLNFAPSGITSVRPN